MRIAAYLRSKSCKTSESDSFDIDILQKMLCGRFESIDYASAKDDVKNFIKNNAQLDIWGPEFFKEITKQLKAVF